MKTIFKREEIKVFVSPKRQQVFKTSRDTIFDTPYRQTVFTRIKNVCS